MAVLVDCYYVYVGFGLLLFLGGSRSELGRLVADQLGLLMSGAAVIALGMLLTRIVILATHGNRPAPVKGIALLRRKIMAV